MAAVLADDAHCIIKAQPQSVPWRLGGEKRLEDTVLQLRRNAGAGIPDFDQHHFAFQLTRQLEAALIPERIERIFHQGGPDLVQFAAIGADAGQVGLVIALYADIRHSRLQHLDGGLEAGRHVNLENRRAVHEGVGLDGADQVEDPVRRVDKRLHRTGRTQKACKEMQRNADFVGAQKRAQFLQVADRDSLLCQLRHNLPYIAASERDQPGAQGLLANYVFLSIGGLIRWFPAEDFLLPELDSADLVLVKAQIDQLEAILTIGAQLGNQAGGCALGRGGRVVQFVRQIAGKLAQSVEFFGLLLNAGNFAHAVKQGGDYPLAHGWNSLQHLRENRLGNQQGPYV